LPLAGKLGCPLPAPAPQIAGRGSAAPAAADPRIGGQERAGTFSRRLLLLLLLLLLLAGIITDVKKHKVNGSRLAADRDSDAPYAPTDAIGQLTVQKNLILCRKSPLKDEDRGHATVEREEIAPSPGVHRALRSVFQSPGSRASGHVARRTVPLPPYESLRVKS
jgi:hypothetical protein